MPCDAATWQACPEHGLFQAILQDLTQVVFRTDAAGLWTFLNPAWTEITGFSVEESLGKLFLDYVHPDDRARNTEKFKPLIERKKEQCRHIVRYLHHDGGFRWIEVMARLTLLPDGSVSGTCGTLTDVTERHTMVAELEAARRDLEQRVHERTAELEQVNHELQQEVSLRRAAQRAIEQKEHYYRSLIENLNDGVFVLDADMHIVFCTPSVGRVIGVNAADLIGCRVGPHLHPDDLPRVVERFRKIIAEPGSEVPTEFRVRCGSGWRLLESRGNNQLANPAVGGVVITIRDITAQRQSELALRESEQRYRTFVEQSGDGIWCVDYAEPVPVALPAGGQSELLLQNGRLVECNEALAKMFGMDSASEMLGAPVEALLGGGREEGVRRVGQLIAGGYRLTNIQTEEVDVNSRPFSALSSIVCVIQNSQVVRIWGVLRNLSESEQIKQLVRQGTRQLEALRETTLQIASELDLDTLLGAIGRRAIELVGADSGGCCLLDEASGELEVRVTIRDGLPLGLRIRSGEGVSGRVLATGQAIMVQDYSSWGGRLTAYTGPTGTLLAIPIRGGDSTIGVLQVFSTTRASFTREETDLLTLFAAHAGIAIRNALAVSRLWEVQEALRESVERFRGIFDGAPIGIALLDQDGNILEANRALESILEWSIPELRIACLWDLLERDCSREARRQLAVAGSRHAVAIQGRYKRKSGQDALGRLTVAHVGGGAGRDRALAMIEDITQQRELEEQLRQAVKMEAIGLLAGGIAHDFNNLLTVIKGYSELLLNKAENGSPVHRKLTQIHKAAQRAADLVSQLLAFSRKQVVENHVFDVNEAARDVEQMLARLIGENIKLVTSYSADAGSVWMDRGQFSQIIMNLAINARDAMPDGGTLTIATARDPGHGVVLTVSDTGIGMSDEVRARIFEPFFTTKPVGKGTGLGLSTVYGIVKQADGCIDLSTRPAEGTTFRVCLPAAPEMLPEPAAGEEAAMKKSTGTVLIAEDEEQVRLMLAETLEDEGLAVLTAVDGIAALETARSHPGKIDLLLTDVMMPRMGGLELADQLTAERPDTKVLFLSGYYDSEITGLRNFFKKPVSPEALVRWVRNKLIEPARG